MMNSSFRYQNIRGNGFPCTLHRNITVPPIKNDVSINFSLNTEPKPI